MSKQEIPPTSRGYVVWEVVSSYQKAIRRSNIDAALYWGLEAFWSGHDAWMWSRLKTIVSEDICAAGLPADVAALYEWYREDKKKQGDGALHFANATVLAAHAPKTRIADWALSAFDPDRSDDVREIPDEALDMHTRRGLQMGRGNQHFWDEAGRLIQPAGAPEVPAEIQRLEEKYRSQSADQYNVSDGNEDDDGSSRMLP